MGYGLRHGQKSICQTDQMGVNMLKCEKDRVLTETLTCMSRSGFWESTKWMRSGAHLFHPEPPPTIVVCIGRLELAAEIWGRRKQFDFLRVIGLDITLGAYIDQCDDLAYRGSGGACILSENNIVCLNSLAS